MPRMRGKLEVNATTTGGEPLYRNTCAAATGQLKNFRTLGCIQTAQDLFVFLLLFLHFEVLFGEHRILVPAGTIRNSPKSAG